MDYKALEHFMTSKELNARQACWAKALAEYHFVIQYCKGKDNLVADALTRCGNDVETQNTAKKRMRLQ